jgi:hypothetical protein
MKHVIITSAGLLVAIAACGRGEQKGPYAATLTSAQVTSSDSAAQQLADAECKREQLCDNIGAGKSYDSRDSCLTQKRREKLNDLRREECPRDVSTPDLKDCLHDIEARGCGNPLGALAKSAACRTGKLCIGE